jgi:hypothetical protein
MDNLMKNLYQKGNPLSNCSVRTLTDRSHLRYKKDAVSVVFQCVAYGVKGDDAIRTHPF